MALIPLIGAGIGGAMGTSLAKRHVGGFTTLPEMAMGIGGAAVGGTAGYVAGNAIAPGRERIPGTDITVPAGSPSIAEAETSDRNLKLRAIELRQQLAALEIQRQMLAGRRDLQRLQVQGQAIQQGG